ncbi:MAG: DUF2993 domain-containing protein [Kaiparowitsia implicata GSE-PSE-MK54-09C]|jgi:hypothetical protein|nr:DUF2993 domain-containing protein [Kaiparowitsia implicata GSE-PSE-MK54-09C]
MEFFTILLSALLGLASPVGIVADRLVESAVRRQFQSVDSLTVRIDNTPSYQVVRGRVDRVRLAGRGLVPIDGVRLEVLEVETDAIALNPSRIRSGNVELAEPLQAGVRLVLTEADLQQTLQSEQVRSQLQQIRLQLPGASGAQRYTLTNPQIELLPNARLRLQVTLQDPRAQQAITTAIESGLAIHQGSHLQLVDPALQVDGQAVPQELVPLVTQAVEPLLNLQTLERSGITARLLELNVEEDYLELAAFIRLDPATFSGL